MSSVSPTDQESALAPDPSAGKAVARIRLDFLDGLRGVAALYVVIHHAYLEVAWWQAMRGPHIFHGERLPQGLLKALHFLTYGDLSVDAFIVLSGYCLMLPVVKARSTGIPGGNVAYIKRRAQRILPPYYAALMLSWLLIALIPALNHKAGVRWDADVPAFTPLVIVSHLLLVHNLFTGLAFTVDYPMWSVATEWQIYFLFPLFLLPMARRFGPITPIVVGTLAGIVPLWLHAHNHLHHDFTAAAPWFIGLFAMGMLGATLNFDPAYSTARWINKFTVAAFGVLWAALWYGGDRYWNWQSWQLAASFGLAVTGLIVYCAHSLTADYEGPAPVIVRVLESKFCTGLGLFSYSLYLIHAPLLAIMHQILRTMHLAPVLVTAILIFVGTPVCIAFAYLFHRVFERPFMRLPAAHQRRTEA